VPFVIGDNSEETLLWFKDKPLGDLGYRLRMRELLGKQKGDAVLARYPASAYANAKAAFVAATTDAVFICPARSIARAMAKSQREPVFRYLFTHSPELRRRAASGALHGIELLFVFHHMNLEGYQATPGEENLSRAMMDAWSRFAKDGDPGWPRYDPATDPYEKLDDTVASASGLRTEHCDFWDSVGTVP
jgi:para-nitrobenzyl esterase